jgi:hypothetical protein
LAIAGLLYAHRYPPPLLPVDLGIEQQFSGSLALPKAAIDRALGEGRAKMLSEYHTGIWLRHASEMASVIGFLASSTVTLILGWWGRSSSNAPAPEGAQSPPVTPRAARWIGVLAALAAVLTGATHFASESSKEYFARADQQRDRLNQAAKDIKVAKSEAEAHAVLDSLLIQTER